MTFAPQGQADGARTATLEIPSNAASSPDEVALIGDVYWPPTIGGGTTGSGSGGTGSIGSTGAGGGAGASSGNGGSVRAQDLPRVLTGYTNPQYKPYIITTTGDGSGFYGGRTGNATEPPHSRHLGRLNWTSYASASATATGVDWAKFGPGSVAAERYHIEGTVKLTLSRLMNGIFTRLVVLEHFNQQADYFRGKTETYKFTAVHGYWSETSRY